jgi:hypothetical protein
MASCRNDINVIHHSPVFSRLAEGNALMVNYMRSVVTLMTMGTIKPMVYYPSRSIFVKTINLRKEEKESRFAKGQEAARKDLERTFSVLLTCSIIRHPIRT